MENKKALILCGGGARGGYHIGVWKALKELNYKPNMITGASVGALNGALLSIGEDKLAEEIWENINMETVFAKQDQKDLNSVSSPTEFMLEMVKIGGVEPTPLKELVNRLADEEKFRKSDVMFGLVVTGVKPFRRVTKFVDEIEEGKIADYILASSACFPIMKMYEINGENYVDGGYTDNVPYEMAVERGANDLVIVDMPGMFKSRKMDCIDATVRYVFPKYDLGNFIIFDKIVANKNMKLGYLDTLRAFEKLEGNYYYFKPNSNVEACKYNLNVKTIYKRVFFPVQNVGKLERVATDKLIACIRKYDQGLFDNLSDTLAILEIASQVYEIDYTRIYDFKELANIVVDKYKETIKKIEYKRLLLISKKLEEINNIEQLREIIKQYGKEYVIAYLVDLLKNEDITRIQKNEVLSVATIKPEYVFSAIFVAGYLK